MFTCFIRYVINPNKMDEFEKYAHTWISLIEKYGGIHHGYFLPGNPDDLPDSSFSFPDIGKSGPNNIAVALFSFSNLKDYETYRKAVGEDEECKAISSRFNETKCFISYERNFLKPIFPEKTLATYHNFVIRNKKNR